MTLTKPCERESLATHIRKFMTTLKRVTWPKNINYIFLFIRVSKVPVSKHLMSLISYKSLVNELTLENCQVYSDMSVRTDPNMKELNRNADIQDDQAVDTRVAKSFPWQAQNWGHQFALGHGFWIRRTQLRTTNLHARFLLHQKRATSGSSRTYLPFNALR